MNNYHPRLQGYRRDKNQKGVWISTTKLDEAERFDVGARSTPIYARIECKSLIEAEKVIRRLHEAYREGYNDALKNVRQALRINH